MRKPTEPRSGTWSAQNKLDVDATNPESHWLRELLYSDDPAGVRTAVPITFAMTPDFAAATLSHMRAPENTGPLSAPYRDFLKLSRIDQATLSALEMATKATAEVGEDAPRTLVSILMSHEAVALLQSVVDDSDTQGLGIFDIGVPLRGDIEAGGHSLEDGPPSEETSSPRKSAVNEVIVAIIDSGIGFANTRFREDQNKSRFDYFWAMDAFPDQNTVNTGPAVGRELTRDAIEDALAKWPSRDEKVYTELKMVQMRPHSNVDLLRRYSHGTHVLDIAAGADPGQQDNASAPRLLGIQLPHDLVADMSGVGAAPWLDLALQWLLHRSLSMAKTSAETLGQSAPLCSPLVLNFSFGAFAGPMDGHGAVETVLAQFRRMYSSLPGNPACEIVVPAGNGFQARARAKIDMSERSTTKALQWRVQPDDRTASFVEIWLPPEDAGKQRVAVSLTPPNADTKTYQVGQSVLGHAIELTRRGALLARIYHDEVMRGKDSRERITIALRPTAQHFPRLPIAPAGAWTITLKNENLCQETHIVLAIHRDDTPWQHRPSGRQSYFDSPYYVDFDRHSGRRVERDHEDSDVRRTGTLNAYASSSELVTVAGYRESDGHKAWYSGAGEAGNGKPDLAAVSERSPERHGVRAAGTMSGSSGSFGGTSVAAPVVVGVIADLAVAGSVDEILDQARVAEASDRQGSQRKYEGLPIEWIGNGRL